MLKKLFEYEVLIDAEGRCENYKLHGYVAADDAFDARLYIKKRWSEDGENILKVTITEFLGNVDIVA